MVVARAPGRFQPVVLTRWALLRRLGTVTVAAITTTSRGTHSEVALGLHHGMPKPGAINLHNVHTLQQSELGPVLATLANDVMERGDEALHYALGLGERGADLDLH